ncbi:matrixin family protein [Medicago truncatula]|uniref:Matrixin family protein n=1 Tax=Medicago truncatula TaxID=3880 RepID=G7K5K3_MEDTR|nr:matrixin family protein [Medicago truncatula]
MMKLYQFELLLFLLLIIDNTTLSQKISPKIVSSILKPILKEVRQQATEYALKKSLDKITQSPTPEQQAEVIQGLYQIKQYLYYFGYLQQYGPFNNVLDQQTMSAIKIYQQNFNLQVTNGYLNTETSQQILLPRCGVPDMNFEYSFTNDKSFPKGNNETTSYDDADIKIRFYNINYIDGVDDVVVGDAVIKLGSNVNSGLIRLIASKYWVLPTDNYMWSWQNGEFDLETAAMYQIGHLLGLDHSFDKESVMYPAILPLQQRKLHITDSDNQAIQQIYSNANSDNGGCFTMFGSSSGLLTSLFLGFAFVALLN